MKTILYKILVLSVIAGAASAELRSQAFPDSLAAYLEIAARNNPGVQKSLYDYQAALQKVPQVSSLPDPELTAGFFLKPMELMSGNQVADFQLMQMFPWFGVLRNAKDEMSLMAQAKYELFRDAKLQVGYDVQKAWYELFKVREEIRISEKNIELLRTIERLSLIKFKSPSAGGTTSLPAGSMTSPGSRGGMEGGSAGMGNMAGVQTTRRDADSRENQSSMQSLPMGSSTSGSGLADFYRIQIEILGLEDNIASLKNQERTSVARFNSILDRSPEHPVYVDTITRYSSVGLEETMDPDSLLADNPMLKMISYENQSLEARKKMISGMSYPMMGIGINYSLINKSPMSESAMNGSDMVMPMVTVTIPVYRKKYNAMKSETDLLKSSSEKSYRATENSLKVELLSAMLDYQDISRRVKLYESQHSLAARSLDLMLKDFSASASSLTDVLRLRQQIYEYELNLIEARADLNITSARITRLMAYTI
ncbi:MAG: TolC family protein [Bacteroidales bacterium]|jgi:outer membrane protein TolC|nr:TolC family protein [Bacteroidales bacterium]MDX9904527.1 TolC family protein [Bacteroidales bacterium]HNX84438.1 TolC family protein [Bacteroidales bacterium]HOC48615.1 TolC family protein [Bacteroidales bacterium]HPS98020.1 TolC family protein [Bacteroidales bacterium]